MRQIKSFRLKAHNQLNARKFKADEKKFGVAQPETQTNEHCWDLHGSNIPDIYVSQRSRITPYKPCKGHRAEMLWLEAHRQHRNQGKI